MASHVTAGVKRKSTDLSGNAAKLLKAKSPPVKPVKQCERSNPCDEEADDQVTSSSELLEEHRLQAMSSRGKFMSLDKFFHRQSVEEVSTSGTKELLLPETETSGADINNDVVLSSGNSNAFDMLAFNKLPNLPNVPSVEDKSLVKPSGKKIENIANLLAKAKPKKNLPNLIENCDSKAQSDNKFLSKIVGVGNSDNVATDPEDTSACVNTAATVSTAIVEGTI